MDIFWLGYSCFRIKGKEATIVTDPYNKVIGYTLGRLSAEIVTVSHDHAGHNNVAAVSGQPRVIDGPGEYEIADVFLTGISSYHDAEKGKKLGKNTIYTVELDDMILCHLGDLGDAPTPAQVEALGRVDILLAPVGGNCTINAAKAAETVSLLEPKVVIPMHFSTEGLAKELDPLDKFLKEMGLKQAVPQPKATLNKSGLPQETQVVVLEHKH